MYRISKEQIYFCRSKIIEEKEFQDNCYVNEIQKYMERGWYVSVTLLSDLVRYLGFVSSVTRNVTEYVIKLTDNTILIVE